MIYRYEFEADDFAKGYCPECPMAYYKEIDVYEDYTLTRVDFACVLGRSGDCPLEEVEDD